MSAASGACSAAGPFRPWDLRLFTCPIAQGPLAPIDRREAVISAEDDLGPVSLRAKFYRPRLDWVGAEIHGHAPAARPGTQQDAWIE